MIRAWNICPVTRTIWSIISDQSRPGMSVNVRKKLVDYSNDLTEKDLCDSIEKLKNVLKTKIAFYRSINGKLYQEINGEYKRIRR